MLAVWTAFFLQSAGFVFANRAQVPVKRAAWPARDWGPSYAE